ncbi:MAG TPA: hypothetical protein GX506_05855 [Firmicutes bacterium]|nr:hypothetical protein [Bacillota bacterium]
MDSTITISPATEFKGDVVVSGLLTIHGMLTMTTATDKIRIEFESLGVMERAVSAVLELYLMALREQEFAIESRVEGQEGYVE